MIYFFSFIFFIFSVILISDFLPDFYTWLNRIKIGKYSNDHIWQEKVVQKSISWLNNIPKTKIKDENRLLVLDILKNQYCILKNLSFKSIPTAIGTKI